MSILNKSVEYGRLRLGISWRSSKSVWGRFGGGWNWKVGFQASSTTVIFSLLILEVRVSWYKP